MSKQTPSAAIQAGNIHFVLKPLVAGVKKVLATGLLVTSFSVQADLPIPVPGGGGAFASYGSADISYPDQNNMVINQHTDKAILNWQKFNVGANNSVNFEQPNAASVALNNIHDQNASQILGHVTANGQIYLYNQNGFVFGNGAVVDTNSFVASTLNVTDAAFQKGLANGDGQLALDNGNVPNNGTITVANGASIHAAQAGRILLAAPEVTNNGKLATDTQGQILLVASQDKVYLQNNTASKSNAWYGLMVEVGKGGKVTNNGDVAVRQGNITMAGFAVNQNGRVNATTSVNLNGSIRLIAGDARNSALSQATNIDDNTVLKPNSTVRHNTDGTVSYASVTLGPNSTTEIDADPDGAQSLDPVIDPATGKNIDSTLLPVQSFVEVTAHTVDLQSGAQIVAPAGNVNIIATDNPNLNQFINPSPAIDGSSGRILIESGAKIDVSGLQNVAIAVDRNIADISVQSYELRNSPLQLTGLLKGLTVKVDTSLNTTIIDTTAAAAAIKRGIEERMTTGGQIKLTSSGDVAVNGQVLDANGNILQNPATLNIAGGSLAYQPGYVHTTKLLTDNAQIVDISNADPNLHYAKVYGIVKEDHNKWGVTQIWDILAQFSQGDYRAGYIQGANAGSLSINAPLVFWNGMLQAGVTSGSYQRAITANGYCSVGSQCTTPIGGSFTIDLTGFNQWNQQLQDVTFANLPANNLSLVAALATADGKFRPSGNLNINNTLTNNSGVHSLSVTTSGSVTVAANSVDAITKQTSVDNAITMAPGAVLAITANNIALQNNVTAVGGQINLTSFINNNVKGTGNFSLAQNALLDVSGRWINDIPSAQNGLFPTDPLYINGGKVIIKSADGLSILANTDQQGVLIPSIKADGGAWLSAAGSLSYGVGGSIDLEARTNSAAVHAFNLPGASLPSGSLSHGSLSAYSFSKSGTLILKDSNIVIGNNNSSLNDTQILVLGVGNVKANSFDFSPDLGFSDITLSATNSDHQGTLTVTSGTVLNLKAENLQLKTQADNQTGTAAQFRNDFNGMVSSVQTQANYQTKPTGSSIFDFADIVLLPDSQRQAVKLNLNADGQIAIEGASKTTAGVNLNPSSISVDNSVDNNHPSQINLSSLASILVDGSLNAPGGQIKLAIQDANPSAWANIPYDATQAIWLGSTGQLLADGVGRLSPVDILGRQTGSVLNGGTVTLQADRGYVVLDKNSSIDVSGTQVQLAIPQSTINTPGSHYQLTSTASNGGNIVISTAEGAYLGGNLSAKAGSVSASGGSLTLTVDNSLRNINDINNNPISFPNANGPNSQVFSSPELSINVVQAIEELLPKSVTNPPVLAATLSGTTGSMLPSGLTDISAFLLTNPISGNSHGLTISAQQISAGQFADLSLISQTQPAGGSISKGQVTFFDNVSLATAAHLTIDSPVINWTALDNTGSSVSLSSTYLNLGSSITRSISDTPVSGFANLVAQAQWLQLQGATLWNNFNSISLNSAHDLRLLGKNTNPSLQGGYNDYVGQMLTNANLTLQASQIYPATLSNFTIKSSDGNISILPSGNTDASPLSAGGSLTIIAANNTHQNDLSLAGNISQAGILKAPLGNIILQADTKLSLVSGSTTSVSAAGLLIPFGLTPGGLNWEYPILNETGSNLNSPTPTQTDPTNFPTDISYNRANVINAPPTKLVSLSAPNINIAKGSNIDVTGGGDLISSYFKPVKADFPNFLIPGSKNPDGSAAWDGSFAILPSLGSTLAPSDPFYSASWNNPALGTNYAMGSQIHLQASAGLAEGNYTILPAYYALLPGAYLITPKANTQDQSITAFTSSGLPVVSGYELLAANNNTLISRDTRSSGYQIESSAQFMQYHPQYNLYCAGNCSDVINTNIDYLKPASIVVAAVNAGVTAINVQDASLYSIGDTLLGQGLATGTKVANIQNNTLTLNTATQTNIPTGDKITILKALNENFYASQAQSNSTVTPLLPVDSGHISISQTTPAGSSSNATTGLILDGSISAAGRGRGAQLDIAANNIAVVTNLNQAAQINALKILDSSLNNLGVASLFLGGFRTQNDSTYALDTTVPHTTKINITDPKTGNPIQVTPLQMSSTQGWAVGDTITGPGIANGTTIQSVDGINITVTAQNTDIMKGTQITDTQPALINGSTHLQILSDTVTFANGVNVQVPDLIAGAKTTLLVDTNAHLTASGVAHTGASVFNLNGDAANPYGDSALLRLSTDPQVTVNRQSHPSGTPVTNGTLQVNDGASLQTFMGTDSMLLNASLASILHGDIKMNGGALNLTAGKINLGETTGLSDDQGLNLSNAKLASLTVDELQINSSATVNFYGNVGLRDSNNVLQPLKFKQLSIDAAGLTGHGANGQQAILNADNLQLQNTTAGDYKTSAITSNSSNTIALTGVTGLAIGDHLAGSGLASNTRITAISAVNHSVTVNTPTIAQIAAGAHFTDLGNGDGNGTLIITSNNINQGAGNFGFNGFGKVNLIANNSFTAVGNGNVHVAADLNLDSGYLTAIGGAKFNLDDSGYSLKLRSSASPANPLPAGFGGALQFTADSLEYAANVLLPSGQLSLRALVGNLQLDAAANTDLAGRAVYFGNTPDYTPGGSFTASADNGLVVVAAVSNLDVSSGGGTATGGQLTFNAIQGSVSIDTAANIKATQGSAQFDIKNFIATTSFDQLMTVVKAAGVTQAINFRSRQDAITDHVDFSAKTVNLSADSGGINIYGHIRADGVNGLFSIDQSASSQSNIVTLTSILGLQIGDVVSAPGLAEHTVITKISGNQVTLSSALSAALAAGTILTDNSIFTNQHTITSLNQSTSNILIMADDKLGLLVDSVAGINVGDHLITIDSNGNLLNFKITSASIPNTQVTINGQTGYLLNGYNTNSNLTQRFSTGMTLTDQSHSQIHVNIKGITGLQQGDTVTGAGLANNTVITSIPQNPQFNDLSGNATLYGVILSNFLPGGALPAITDNNSGTTLNIASHDSTLLKSNVITLDSTVGLQVGDYLAGAGVAAYTTITAIDGNNLTLSGTPSLNITAGETITSVAANRYADINGGAINLYAGDTISLDTNGNDHSGSLLSASSLWGKGGQILLSSLVDPSQQVTLNHTAVVLPGNTNLTPQIDVRGIQNGGVDGSVTLRARWGGVNGINLPFIADGIVTIGNGKLYEESVHVYNKAQVDSLSHSTGVLNSSFTSQVYQDIYGSTLQLQTTFSPYILTFADVSNFNIGDMLTAAGLAPNTSIVDIQQNNDGVNWDVTLSKAAVGVIDTNTQIDDNGSNYSVVVPNNILSVATTSGLHTGEQLNIPGLSNPVTITVIDSQTLSFNTEPGVIIDSANLFSLPIIPNGDISNVNQQALGHGITLRPGVEIDYSGDLTLQNNWDLSGWRNTFSPGDLVIRATGQLNISHDLSDGFQTDPNNTANTNQLLTGPSWTYAVAASADLTSANYNLVSGTNALTVSALLRTGTGNIQLNAGGDMTINSTGSVYSAGQASATLPYGSLTQDESSNRFIVEYPVNGGNLAISAGGNIKGAVSGQDVNSWLLRLTPDSTVHPAQDCVVACSKPELWGVAFNLFKQNLGAFGGGAVSIQAGANISNLEVAIPVTGKQLAPGSQLFGGSTVLKEYSKSALDITGGGNLQLHALGSVLGGSFYVGKGLASISAQGAISSISSATSAPLIYSGDTKFNFNAVDGVQLANIQDPMAVTQSISNIFNTSSFATNGTYNSYTDVSSVAIRSLAADIALSGSLFPASMQVTAFGGSVILANPAQTNKTNITLFPSAVGQLHVFAQQDIKTPGTTFISSLSMSDYGGQRKTALNLTNNVDLNSTSTLAPLHVLNAANQSLHVNDLQPVSFVTQSGDIKNIALILPKLTTIEAGRDISNADIYVQNLHTTDATLLIAGRDMIYPTVIDQNSGSPKSIGNNSPQTQIAGPGDVLVETGRNLDLGQSPGFKTIGNNSGLITGLDSQGANITTIVGLQGAIPSYVGFLNSYDNSLLSLNNYVSLDKYVNDSSYPKSLVSHLLQLQSNGDTNTVTYNGQSMSLISFYELIINQYQQNVEKPFQTAELAAKQLISQYMQQLTGNNQLSSEQALTAYAALPAAQSLPLHQQLNNLLLPVLLKEIDINGSASAAYKSIGNDLGYAAINALFPGSSWKGNLNLFFSTLQTQQGGNINLFVPGGSINAGLSVNLLGTAKGADALGIQVQGLGSIYAVIGDDLQVNTSRVLTTHGGDILVWSSYGNIDAGKGAKSAHSVPKTLANLVNGNFVYSQTTSVSGSGLRTEGDPQGNVSLYAPQGVVNAAEAGIGGKNVTISATAVLGAQNIQVSGVSTGVPQAAVGSLAAGLTGASNLGANANQVAQSAIDQDSKPKDDILKKAVLGILSVDIVGFGE